MTRKIACSLAVAAIGSVAWACASGGGSLSSTRYNAEDLAAVQYENMYDFLQAHTRVRVGQTGSSVPLRVRRTTGGGVSMGGADNPTGGAGFGGRGDTTMSIGGEATGGGGASYRGRGGSGRYVQARLYIDDREIGNPIQRLRQLRPSQIEELELLRPSEASAQYGGSGDFGIVSIILKEGE